MFGVYASKIIYIKKYVSLQNQGAGNEEVSERLFYALLSTCLPFWICIWRQGQYQAQSTWLPIVEKLKLNVPWKGCIGTLWRIFNFVDYIISVSSPRQHGPSVIAALAVDQPGCLLPAQPHPQPGLLLLLLGEHKAVLCVSGKGQIAPPVAFVISSHILFHTPWEGLSWPSAMGSLSAAEVAWRPQAGKSVFGNKTPSKIRSAGMGDRRFMRDVTELTQTPPRSWLFVPYSSPHWQNSADIFEPFAFAQSSLSL